MYANGQFCRKHHLSSAKVNKRLGRFCVYMKLSCCQAATQTYNNSTPMNGFGDIQRFVFIAMNHCKLKPAFMADIRYTNKVYTMRIVWFVCYSAASSMVGTAIQQQWSAANNSAFKKCTASIKPHCWIHQKWNFRDIFNVIDVWRQWGGATKFGCTRTNNRVLLLT